MRTAVLSTFFFSILIAQADTKARRALLLENLNPAN